MWQKLLLIIGVFFLAFGVLAASLFRTATVRYAFDEPTPASIPTTLGEETKEAAVDYAFPYPGKVLPDSPLWYLKVLRDKVWMFLTKSPEKKAELKILYADKRAVSARMLFEKEKFEIGYSTLTKAEKYLEEAYTFIKRAEERGVDTKELWVKFTLSSLKHRETLEEILLLAPEDVRPQILKTEDYSRNSYKLGRDELNAIGYPPPENPFDSD